LSLHSDIHVGTMAVHHLVDDKSHDNGNYTKDKTDKVGEGDPQRCLQGGERRLRVPPSSSWSLSSSSNMVKAPFFGRASLSLNLHFSLCSSQFEQL
jgi:hypothetical protein